jgi:hypothetical protein
VTTQLVAEGVKPEDINTASKDKIKKVKKVCRKCYLLFMILCRANSSRYFQLKNDLSINTTKGADNFPKRIFETMRLLTNYKAPPRLQQVRNLDGEGLAFVQGKGAMPHVRKRETARKDEIECWNCNMMGHYKNECTELQVLDEGIKNINFDECNKKHTLFSANNGYGLIQK